jgi:hypothetical protein
MRIEGTVTGPGSGYDPGFKPLLRVTVWTPRIKRSFDFLVDTGSDITALTTIAFKQTRFHPRDVGAPIRKVGGIVERAPTYKFDAPATLKVLDAAHKVQAFPDFQLYAMETDDLVPCILGRDFFVHYKLVLQYDPMKRALVIEGPEPSPPEAAPGEK